MGERPLVVDWTRDFDHNHPDWSNDPHAIWDDLRRRCPVAHTDRYRGVYRGRRVIFVHPDDLAAFGIAPGQWVDITSHFRGEKRVARGFEAIAYPIARRSAATYFPEANALVPVDSVAARSNQPAQKCVRITLQASERNVPA